MLDLYKRKINECEEEIRKAEESLVTIQWRVQRAKEEIEKLKNQDAEHRQCLAEFRQTFGKPATLETICPSEAFVRAKDIFTEDFVYCIYYKTFFVGKFPSPTAPNSATLQQIQASFNGDVFIRVFKASIEEYGEKSYLDGDRSLRTVFREVFPKRAEYSDFYTKVVCPPRLKNS
jgi:hypothetical protein